MSRPFWVEIVDYLESKGLVLGADVFFWEQGWPRDEIIDRFIKHNEKLWKSEARHSKNKVWLPLQSAWHDVSHVTLAYCGNYLAQFYDAEINFYICYGEVRTRDLMYSNKSARDVMRSYNATSVSDFQCNQEQQKKASQIFSQIWSTVNSWQDMRNLTINGINFGISIMRDYLRFHNPTVDMKTEAFYKYLWFISQHIVFLIDYFTEHKDEVKAVVLWDGVWRESFLRDVAFLSAYQLTAFVIRLRRLSAQ